MNFFWINLSSEPFVFVTVKPFDNSIAIALAKFCLTNFSEVEETMLLPKKFNWSVKNITAIIINGIGMKYKNRNNIFFMVGLELEINKLIDLFRLQENNHQNHNVINHYSDFRTFYIINLKTKNFIAHKPFAGSKSNANNE